LAPNVPTTQAQKLRHFFVRWLILVLLGLLSYGVGLWLGYKQRLIDLQTISASAPGQMPQNIEPLKSH